MIRTQIYLPEELHRELKLVAQIENIPFSDLIRKGAQTHIDTLRKKRNKETKSAWDRFIGAGRAKGPKNLSSRIDQYLYGV